MGVGVVVGRLCLGLVAACACAAASACCLCGCAVRGGFCRGLGGRFGRGLGGGCGGLGGCLLEGGLALLGEADADALQLGQLGDQRGLGGGDRLGLRSGIGLGRCGGGTRGVGLLGCGGGPLQGVGRAPRR